MIKDENIQDIYTLTPMQEGMLFHSIYDNSTAYFEQISYRICGNLDPALVERSLNVLFQRYDILRTAFIYEGLERPLQVVLKERRVDFHFEDIQAKEPGAREKYLREFRINDRRNVFDLARDVSMRVTLHRTGPREYEFTWSNHHILMDGWCTGILTGDFLEIYNSYLENRPCRLAEVKPYKIYIEWLEQQDKGKSAHFWKEYLAGFEEAVGLPRAVQLPGLDKPAFDNRIASVHLDAARSAGITRLAAENNVTLNTLLQALWGILLYRYTGKTDILFGSVVSGRPPEIPGVESMVGLFLNTIPVRQSILPAESVAQSLRTFQDQALAMVPHHYYPLAAIQSQTPLKQNLFDHFMVFENYPLAGQLEGIAAAAPSSPSGLKLEISHVDVFEQTNYPMFFRVFPGEYISLNIEYNGNEYEKEIIEGALRHFRFILHQVLAVPPITIDGLELLGEDERQMLLVEFNKPSASYSLSGTQNRDFEKQSESTPHRLSLRFRDRHLTYRMLNAAADDLAKLIRQNEVTTGTIVGIMLEPSLDMVVALLAIFKAGGAYLPISPDQPPERTRYMLEDTGADVIITQGNLLKTIPFSTLQSLEEKNTPDIVVTLPREPIKQFDALPMPDRQHLNLKNYQNRIGMASVTNAISLQTTRGCPFECLYCHKIWSKKYTARSAEKIFEEIQCYYQKGVFNFACIDDCFNLDIENSSRLFRMIIKNKLKSRFFFPNGLRGDIMTPDYIDLMVEAGTRGINLSLETASPRLQKLLKKNLNLDKFKEVVDYIAGRHPEVMLELATMHGFPTETEEEAMMTMDFITSVHWLHFPYIHILKIFPNTEMEAFALAHGVKREDILRSRDRAFHELPETLPFPKSFTRKYQADFMNRYFLNRERLKQVLPVQAEILTEKALVQKYNAYLPVEITTIDDILRFTRLEGLELYGKGPEEERDMGGAAGVPEVFYRQSPKPAPKAGQARILFLDLSQHFSSHSMLYNVSEQPLGLVYLLTYLEKKFPDRIHGKIYKSGCDFDSYRELKQLILEYDPQLIGIRTLTFFKEFFHETVSLIRQWGVNVPIITGGPYASSDYDTLLKNADIDLVVFGEGEETLGELIEKMLAGNFRLPPPAELRTIRGIAYAGERSARCQCRRVLILDRLYQERFPMEKPTPANTDLPSPIGAENNLAYIMYTSGSTGKPRGVMVEHRQVNNCIRWMQEIFRLNERALVAQRTALTFDPSVWEIFWPLSIGGGVQLVPAEQRRDIGYLIGLLQGSSGITTMYMPASLLKVVAQMLETLQIKPRLDLPLLITGAEPVRMETVKKFLGYYSGQLVNTYGPTEGTINNTYYPLTLSDERAIVPIGKPAANTSIYIVSTRMHLLPPRVPGEICIGGDSVARGYIKSPEKNASAFIPNPFAAGKLYKTGDLGRWLEDGSIEILGRLDDQLKIRGYRIEPGEIEMKLLKYPAITDVVVVAKSPDELEEPVKECKKCGIWSNYPGIKINNDDICNVCTNMDKYREVLRRYFKTPSHLERKIRESRAPGSSKYDCLLVYACERVATYALYNLLEMGLNVLTTTYDSGHYEPASLERIRQTTAQIGVDHVFLRHERSDEILKESLAVAHTMCKGCIHTSTSLAAKYAYENGIRFVIGETLSRGQIVENKLYRFLEREIYDVDEIEKEIEKVMRSVASIDKRIFDIIDIDIMKDGSVYNKVEFLDFYRYFDVTNQEIVEYLEKKDSYWKELDNKAIYSTDCKICQVGYYNHFKDLGYHYTGSAKSWEQRLGNCTLQTVKKDLTLTIDAKEHEKFLKKLGYQKEFTQEEQEKKICAYYVSDSDLSVSQLREYLLKELPQYMVPSYFCRLDKIPLTSGGKIDRRALPLPDLLRSQLESRYKAPGSRMEEIIARVWQDVLRQEKVGVEDNFFDIGGNSIDIMMVGGKLKEELRRDIPVVTLFTYPTVASLARHLDNNLEEPEKMFSDEEIDRSLETMGQAMDFLQGGESEQN